MITGQDLAEFVARVHALEVTRDLSHNTLELKLGSRIDCDDEPPMFMVPKTTDSIVSLVREIDWDMQEHNASIPEINRLLRSTSGPIYRAFITLENLVDDVQQDLRRAPSPENDTEFVPDTWSIEIGPIETGRDGEFHVGWIAIGLSGNGYLFPWTLPQVIARAQAHHGIQRLVRLCRETWPVKPERVTARIQSFRGQLGKYWPYESLDLPWDWYWGLQGLL